MRIKTKIGDVFSVKLDNSRKQYLQLIAFDLTQLNSDVIRVFKRKYLQLTNPSLSEIVKDDIEFYAHSTTKIGVKEGYWEHVGNISDIGETKEILFRTTDDDLKVKTSQNWWIWEINEKARFVGKIEGENRKAEIGCVVHPEGIVYRMNTRKYKFVYPEIE